MDTIFIQTLALGGGLWVGFAFLIVYYFIAYTVTKHKRARERSAELIRGIVVPSRDAHLAEKTRGE